MTFRSFVVIERDIVSIDKRQVEIPSKPSALRRFLFALCRPLNLSPIFHVPFVRVGDLPCFGFFCLSSKNKWFLYSRYQSRYHSNRFVILVPWTDSSSCYLIYVYDLLLIFISRPHAALPSQILRMSSKMIFVSAGMITWHRLKRDLLGGRHVFLKAIKRTLWN